MFLVGDTEYPLCLLDTNAVSEMVKRPEGAFVKFYDWSHDFEPMYVPAFTIYTLMEIRRQPALFADFVKQFHPFPCVMVKGYMELLEEEVASYPDPSGIDICSIPFTPLGGAGNLLSNIPTLLDTPTLLAREAEWYRDAPEIVDGAVSLVPNYPPAGDTYTAEEEREFVDLASFQQLVLHGHQNLAERILARSEGTLMDAFPSLKAMTYTVFHKFYVDRTREPRASDGFDILISSAFPYVEAVITDAHMAESYRKVKRRDDFVQHLEVFTLREFQQSLAA